MIRILRDSHNKSSLNIYIDITVENSISLSYGIIKGSVIISKICTYEFVIMIYMFKIG